MYVERERETDSHKRVSERERDAVCRDARCGSSCSKLSAELH
jgi:hypothetical protein